MRLQGGGEWRLVKVSLPRTRAGGGSRHARCFHLRPMLIRIFISFFYKSNNSSLETIMWLRKVLKSFRNEDVISNQEPLCLGRLMSCFCVYCHCPPGMELLGQSGFKSGGCAPESSSVTGFLSFPEMLISARSVRMVDLPRHGMDRHPLVLPVSCEDMATRWHRRTGQRRSGCTLTWASSWRLSLSW